MQNKYQLILLFCILFGTGRTVEGQVYKDGSQPASVRTLDLLQRMTIEEKVAQTLVTGVDNVIFENEGIENEKSNIRDYLKTGIGGFENMKDKRTPGESAEFINEIQKMFITSSRLGIPVRIHTECLHGQNASQSTVFPVPIGLSCSWDTVLVKEVYSVIAKEARARGCSEAHTPVLDIARDPRWGRFEETYGEDTYLTSRMAVAMVKGLQGEGKRIDNEHVIATCKHFAGYGQVAGGRNFAPTDIPQRMFMDEILLPFKAAVTEANAMGVMPSHCEIDGVPCHANRDLLNGILRENWGFKGVVVSDYNDVSRLDGFMNIANNDAEAAKLALMAGVDMDLPNGGAYRTLTNLIREDNTLENYLDSAVYRILYSKFLLGLFDDPYVDPKRADEVVNCWKHQELALRAAEESITLLKNEVFEGARKLLPVDTREIRKIAVIGPNANPVQLGDYIYPEATGTSILDGFKEKAGDDVDIIYSQGCRITKLEEQENGTKWPVLYSWEEEKPLIDEAVKKAEGVDLAVICVGGDEYTSRESVYAEKGIGDMASLKLPGHQNELVKAVVETGVPVVVILVHGKPYSINYIQQNVPAILDIWFSGEKTGEAVANVLFGDANPCGKLTVTVPRSVGQLPVYYSQKPSASFKKYLFVDNSPLYPFGFGLSYTTFAYSNFRLDKQFMTGSDIVRASVDITNTGNIKGKEIAQMYIRDVKASVTSPIMELKDFAKTELYPGETKTITFKITPDKLMFTGPDYQKVLEPGEVEIMIGSSSQNIFRKQILTIK